VVGEMILEIFLTSVLIAISLSAIIAKKGELDAKLWIVGSLLIGGISGVITYMVDYLFDISSPFLYIPTAFLFVIIIGITAVFFRFYRDPNRNPPNDGCVVLSPADGKIKYIRRIEKGTIVCSKDGKDIKIDELIGNQEVSFDDGLIVGIGMTILDVHVNRSPISGKICFLKHIGDKFLSLKLSDAVIMNERNVFIIKNDKLHVGVIQIASRLVRKIVSYKNLNDSINAGERIGAILFGSQVDLVLPQIKGLKILCREGDQVYAGISIICTIPP
jgi:phosphatidylserine decarboxylase